ncbi:MAG: hypothetical protein JNM57_01390 [Cyclobacteriaceae bacterium]|nr:hypothetical protein [Cyclobacteriaceae bacterium]
MKTETLENQVRDTEVCCPEFNPALWNDKKHVWNNKLFLKDSVPEFFHIPLPNVFGKVISRMWEKATDAGAVPEVRDFLMLAHDPTPFRGELLLFVTHEIPGGDHIRLSGTFMSKVFDGPYSSVPTFMKEMNEYLTRLKMKAKKYYFYYAYCPKCSKKYGHNYIVAIAEVA